MRESRIERHFVERVRALGGEVRKLRWIGRRGAPDRVAMLPDGSTLWVELKAPGAQPAPHQAREHERMRRMRQVVLVLDSIAAIDEALT